MVGHYWSYDSGSDEHIKGMAKQRDNMYSAQYIGAAMPPRCIPWLNVAVTGAMFNSSPRSLILVARHNPHDFHTWSGIPAHLAAALAARGVKTLPVQSHPVRLRRLIDYYALRITMHVPSLCLLPSHLARVHESHVAAHRLRHHHETPCVLSMGDLFDPGHAPLKSVALLVDQCMGNIMEHARQHGFPSGYEIHAHTWREQWAWQNRVFRHARIVFAASNWARAAIIRYHGVAPDRVVTVGFGASIDVPVAQVPATQRDEKTLLFVGYDWERKGGPLLMAAFRRLRQVMPDVRLTIAGCRPVLDEPGVTVLGPVDKDVLRGLYARAAIFVMPSLYEPFGMVYLEAMCFGLPVVALCRNASPEIIVDGLNGALCADDSPDTLAATS